MKNDQHFNPGDKVVRVSGNEPGSNILPDKGPFPEYGKVYCVEDFHEGRQFNMVMLVGFGGWRFSSRGEKVGWAASAFRKIEEIKLCVSASTKISEANKQPDELLTPPPE